MWAGPLPEHFFLFSFPLNHLPPLPPYSPPPACYIVVMATPAQIAANQANAQKSTGPRSVEGKSASRFIPGEEPADYEALAAHYHREFRPASPSEIFHVEAMLRADWQKRRLLLVAADLHRTLLAETPGVSLAAALLSDSPAARL